MAPNLIIPATLTKIYQSDEVMSTIVRLFYFQGQHIRLLNHLIYRELVEVAEKDPGTLFRQDSLATKASRAYMKLVGHEYLQRILSPLLNDLLTLSNSNFEVDPVKESNPKVIEENLPRLMNLTNRFLESILRISLEIMP